MSVLAGHAKGIFGGSSPAIVVCTIPLMDRVLPPHQMRGNGVTMYLRALLSARAESEQRNLKPSGIWMRKSLGPRGGDSSGPSVPQKMIMMWVLKVWGESKRRAILPQHHPRTSQANKRSLAAMSDSGLMIPPWSGPWIMGTLCRWMSSAQYQVMQRLCFSTWRPIRI